MMRVLLLGRFLDARDTVKVRLSFEPPKDAKKEALVWAQIPVGFKVSEVDPFDKSQEQLFR
jgi:hypothetical protein